MTSLRVTLAWITAGLFALAAVVAVPIAMEAETLLANEDDPAAIADQALSTVFDRPLAIREIEAALAANDADLANSFLELARERGVAVPPALADKVTAAVERANSTAAHVESFARGSSPASRRTWSALPAPRSATCSFMATSAMRCARARATSAASRPTSWCWASRWSASPSRPEPMLRSARRARRASASPRSRRRAAPGASAQAWRTGLAARCATWWTGRRSSAPALPIANPATAMREARTVVKADKAGGLMKLVGDVGTVQAKAGTQAALDGLKLAQGPREMARVAKLAEKKGGKTRAILKTLGRGAILLSLATFNLAAWIFGAILTLFGFVSSAKSGVERLTQRAIDRGKERRQERYLAMTETRA